MPKNTYEMKQVIVIILGLGLIFVGGYFFLYKGLVEVIYQIKNQLPDIGDFVWGIIRVVPLSEITIGIGFMTLFGGGLWSLYKWFDD